jgi:LysM repeat protein
MLISNLNPHLFMKTINSALSCPTSFLKCLKFVCIAFVFSLINFGNLGCGETSTYNPYNPAPAIADSSSTAGIESSQMSDRHTTFKVKDLPPAPGLTQEEVLGAVKDSLKSLQDEIFIPDTTKLVKKKIAPPALKKSTSIASSQKSGRSSSAGKEIYNCPCESKRQIKAGDSAWNIAKYNGFSVDHLIAINKPGVVKQMKLGVFICLKRKKC